MEPPAFQISRPEGTVTMVLQALEENGELICGIRQVVGTIPAAPKAWVRAVREEVAKIETLAREAGCAELRIAGRDWSRIVEGFEPLPGLLNGIRKRL